jgi:ABC-2 type transport system permease protein
MQERAGGASRGRALSMINTAEADRPSVMAAEGSDDRGPSPRYELTPAVWRGPGALGRFWDLLHNLVSRAIKQRYKRSVLGFAWTMLNPLITMTILTIVFSKVFAPNVARYPLFVIIGLLAWNLFALGSTQGLASIVDSGHLIRKVAVPNQIFPIAAVGANLVNFAFAMVPLLGILLVLRVGLTPAILFVPFGVALIAMFTLGVALFLATLNVFFRDVRYLYEAALLAWFYATPIFYPIDILPPAARAILRWNPMYVLVDVFRMPLYAGVAPPWPTVAIAAAEAALALAVGWTTFRRYQARFIDYV